MPTLLIHPWDSSYGDSEWRAWLADGRDFGQLVVNGQRGGPPTVVPTHFLLKEEEVLTHFAASNPVWDTIYPADSVVLSVVDDDAYVPGPWRTAVESVPSSGVPTSYYSAVQIVCRPMIVDDPQDKASLLEELLAHFQPSEVAGPVSPTDGPFAQAIDKIRGLRLTPERVDAKFKYDDHKPVEVRSRIAEWLDQRGAGRDHGAAAQQRRRVAEVGEMAPKSSSSP